MLTLADCRTDRGLVAVARVDTSTQEFTDLVNEACRRLLDYGDWWATVVKARFAVYGRQIVWPRWVGTVLAIKECGSRLKSQNSWYDFIPLSDADYRCIGACYPRCCGLSGDVSVEDIGTAAVASNVPAGSSNYILVYPRSVNDAGKTLTLWGTDENGWPATETLVMPNIATTLYVSSVRSYRSINRVEKDVTSDWLDAYQCATSTAGTLLDLSHYAPGETRAEYRISMIKDAPHLGMYDSATDQYVHYVEALLKLQHVPAVSASDLVSIGNAAAIKLMIMSIHKEEAADAAGAEGDAQRAVHELNRELNNKLPPYQIAVSHEPLNGVNVRRYSAF